MVRLIMLVTRRLSVHESFWDDMNWGVSPLDWVVTTGESATESETV